MKKPVAAFDFDGTITSKDTIWPFLTYAVGTPAIVRGLPLVMPALCAYGVGLLSPTRTKAKLFKVYLRNRWAKEVWDTGKRFARERIPSMIRPEALARIRWHRSMGHHCVIVTASPECYVAPWAEAEGLCILGTKLETDPAGLLTGNVDGMPCDGNEKVRRLLESIGADQKVHYAYGDSAGDKQMLELAGNSYFRVFPRENALTY